MAIIRPDASYTSLGFTPDSEYVRSAELLADAPVLICLPNPGPESQLAALAAGASAVLVHSATREAVVEALRDVLRGQTRLDLPNNHLEYAITWYALAGVLAAIYALYCLRHLKGEPAA